MDNEKSRRLNLKLLLKQLIEKNFVNRSAGTQSNAVDCHLKERESVMRYNSLSYGVCLAILAMSVGGAEAASEKKTPKECNVELYQRLAVIKAAGETPSQFIHDCWYRSQAGQPTAIMQPSARRGAAPLEAKRGVQAPVPGVRTREARAVRLRSRASSRSPMAVEHQFVGARKTEVARIAERQRRRMARIARATRVRIARLAAAMTRSAQLRVGPGRRAPTWSVARSEPTRLNAARGRNRLYSQLKTVTRTETSPQSRISAQNKIWEWGDTASAAAALGPSARVGQRMWVRVVAAGEVNIKPAVAVGRLADRPGNDTALNCWGQQVMFVGSSGKHWSRGMVCDGKPAGSNEWSAQIYYGGPATR